MKKWTLLFVALAVLAMAAVASAEHGSGAGGIGPNQGGGAIEPFRVSQGGGTIEPFAQVAWERADPGIDAIRDEHGPILDRVVA